MVEALAPRGTGCLQHCLYVTRPAPIKLFYNPSLSHFSLSPARRIERWNLELLVLEAACLSQHHHARTTGLLRRRGPLPQQRRGTHHSRAAKTPRGTTLQRRHGRPSRSQLLFRPVFGRRFRSGSCAECLVHSQVGRQGLSEAVRCSQSTQPSSIDDSSDGYASGFLESVCCWFDGGHVRGFVRVCPLCDGLLSLWRSIRCLFGRDLLV